MLRFHGAVLREETLWKGASLTNSRHQYDHHAEDQEAVAPEYDRLAGVARNRQNRHLPAALHLVAGLEELETAPMEWVVHPDFVLCLGSGCPIDDRDKTAKHCWASGARVVVNLKIIQGAFQFLSPA